MTIEEILRGETTRVEFKESLPRDAAKYVKTVVAFANCQGGQLVIGVADETREVVGLDDTAGALPGPYKYRIEAKVGNEWVTAIDASANTTDLFVDYRETPRIENVEAVRLVILGSPVGITASIYDFTAFTE